MTSAETVKAAREESYRQKEAYLKARLRSIDTYDFYREIFPDESFERRGHPEDQKGNGIALQLVGVEDVRRYTVTDELDNLMDLIGTDFSIISPVSYFGKERSGRNARYLYAFVFDLDGVELPQLKDVLHQMDYDFLPTATFIVNSGTGLHLYYLLEEPIPMYPNNQKWLRELKYALIKQIWNIYTSTIREPQMQGILQGYRVVGSASKLGQGFPVTAYWLGERTTVEELLEYVPDTNGDRPRIEELMQKGRLSLEEAKKKYPEWYDKRVVRQEPKGRWVVKRDLYDWWLRRISMEIGVRHRYFGIMTLAIYAKKCNIDEEELQKDAFALMRRYDSLSVDESNRFTEHDVMCALEAYNEDYVTFPRDDIAKLSGLSMPINKRNGRKQKDHLAIARMIQNYDDPEGTWRNKEGRPKRQNEVYEWRMENPTGRKIDCQRETGISQVTLRKWWDWHPEKKPYWKDGHLVVDADSPREAHSIIDRELRRRAWGKNGDRWEELKKKFEAGEEI
ncbi:MAG: hypothetical protein LUE27_03870 [Clostridia bacterium]|nr:hypothetical protein [Clostridia bacterium]